MNLSNYIHFFHLWLFNFRYVTDLTYHKQLTVNSTIQKLRILIELHCTLSKLVATANNLYAFPLLMIVFSIFSYTVFGLFAAYR